MSWKKNQFDALNNKTYFTYDPSGFMTSLTDPTQQAITVFEKTDLENRKSDNSIISSYSFPILDGVGNRMQAVVNEPLAGARTPENTAYTYNVKKNRIETAGSDSFTHDLEGQISTGYNASYTFDYEHRLVGANGNQYSYDGKGNRLKAVRNGVTTHYVYDMNGNVLAEADGNKAITGLYIQGKGLLAMVTPMDQVYSYHFNAIGSTVAITDKNQNVANKYVYDSFGFVLNQVETVPQPFKYVGQYGVMAEPNGFDYMRARYYDPKVGRFVSEDPIGFEGGINVYSYTHDNPVNRMDPMGLDDGWGWWGGWPWNGSPLPGYWSQDNKCSWPAGWGGDYLNKHKCTRDCCIKHDNCYKQFGCNASSWVGSGACQICNDQLMGCLAFNVGKDCNCISNSK